MLHIIAQTEVNWLPVWVAQVWRLGIFVAASWLIGRIFWGFTSLDSDIRSLPIERKVAWVAVMVFTLRALIVSIEDFDEPLHYENSPVTTLALALAIYSVSNIKKIETENILDK